VGCLTTLSVAKLYSVEWVDDTNWRGFGRKWSWPSRDNIPAFAWRVSRKARGTSVRIASVPAGIRTQYLFNRSLDRYCYASPFGTSGDDNDDDDNNNHNNNDINNWCIYMYVGHAVAYLVEALGYKPEGRRFESR
jgi:hypothetical protein